MSSNPSKHDDLVTNISAKKKNRKGGVSNLLAKKTLPTFS
jgi:hypothetical protein